MKSCPKPVLDFESNSERVKSNKRFCSKKCWSDNQQKWIIFSNQDQIKMSVNVKKCGCDYFYVLNY